MPVSRLVSRRSTSLLTTLIAALFIAIYALILSLSYASLVFSGDLSNVLSFGIGLYGVGTVVVLLRGALATSYPGVLINTQDAPAALASLMAASLSARLGNIPAAEKLPTVIAALVVACALVGVAMLPSDSMFFIELGLIDVRLELANGSTKRVRTAQGGTVLGEIGVYLGKPRTASLIAHRASRVYTLTAAQLAAMERDDPLLATTLHRYLARVLAERLSDTSAELRAVLS